jgi:hypothetical protein
VILQQRIVSESLVMNETILVVRLLRGAWGNDTASYERDFGMLASGVFLDGSDLLLRDLVCAGDWD